ncbi:MAG: tetratricopeptide repeat protein [Lachnospirales bacterium]
MNKKIIWAVVIFYVLFFLIFKDIIGAGLTIALLGVITVIVIVMKRYSIMMYVALLNVAQGNEKKAKTILENIIKKGYKSPKVYVYYVNILLRSGNGLRSKELLEEALTLKPDILTYKNIKLCLGSAYWMLGDIDSAIYVLESLREEFEYINPFTLTTLGFMYYLNDNLEKAEKISKEAIADDERNHGAWDNLGQIYLKKGESRMAKECFLKALEYKETLVDSLFYLGVIYEAEGNDDEAKAYFIKASNADITSLNTVTKDDIEERLKKFRM